MCSHLRSGFRLIIREGPEDPRTSGLGKQSFFKEHLGTSFCTTSTSKIQLPYRNLPQNCCSYVTVSITLHSNVHYKKENHRWNTTEKIQKCYGNVKLLEVSACFLLLSFLSPPRVAASSLQPIPGCGGTIFQGSKAGSSPSLSFSSTREMRTFPSHNHPFRN